MSGTLKVTTLQDGASSTANTDYQNLITLVAAGELTIAPAEGG